MADVEVTLTDRLDTEIDRLVEQDDFINREQAVEEILTAGLSAYNTTTSTSDSDLEDTFLQSTSEQEDPAMQEVSGDDYTF
jgi:metal-responsive CopG/Arc/MetJ family transcriptional regulator